MAFLSIDPSLGVRSGTREGAESCPSPLAARQVLDFFDFNIIRIVELAFEGGPNIGLNVRSDSIQLVCNDVFNNGCGATLSAVTPMERLLVDNAGHLGLMELGALAFQGYYMQLRYIQLRRLYFFEL